jgi:tight adherence protein B
MNVVGLLVVGAAVLLLLFGGLWLFSLAQGRQRAEEAMGRLQAGGGDEQAVSLLSDSPEMRIPGVREISRLMWRAGSEVQPRSIVLWLGIIVVLIIVVLAAAGPLFGLPACVFGLLLAYLVLTQRAARRRARIIEQLPTFLENVIRVLSAGNSLEEAIASAARESPDPIKPVFMSVGRQVRLGAPVDQVLTETALLYNLRDVKIMAMAANINRRYGGSLRGVLKSLILAIRQRGIAARELRALTAETRFSAMVLAIVPVGLTSYILITNPTFYSAMWKDDAGRNVLIGGAIWVVIGMFVLWRMVNSIGEDE